MEKLYTIKLNVSSNDIEDLIMQLDTIREKLEEGFESSDTKIMGVSNGSWSISFIERCEYCHGDGEVATDVFDPDSGQSMRGVGSEKCVCQTEK